MYSKYQLELFIEELSQTIYQLQKQIRKTKQFTRNYDSEDDKELLNKISCTIAQEKNLVLLYFWFLDNCTSVLYVCLFISPTHMKQIQSKCKHENEG